MPFSLRWTLWAGLFLATTLPRARAADEEAQPPIAGIGPIGEVTRLHTDLQFTEGPASDGRGNLYFTDIPANRIYRRNVAGQLSVFREPSGHANGLMFTAAGNLVACEMDGRIVEINIKTKEATTLTDNYQDKRYNAPNDLVIDGEGGIYFTDPRFRAPDPLPQGLEAVYYRAPDGQVTRVIDDVQAAPNGVILSIDEKTLYVIPTFQADMLAYAVEGPGKLGAARVFCKLKQPADSQPPGSGGDGLTIDTEGNLYITSRLGIQVFNPEGKLLGIIEFPEQPANVTFGGKENRTLYVTARTSLYAVEMQAQGHVFAAGQEP